MYSCKRGFTLIELMVVVAIIGVLVAVAIPSFTLYMHHSKTSEGRLMLTTVAQGATIYHSSEHIYDSFGLNIFKGIYPGCEEDNAMTLPEACDGVKDFAGNVGVSQRISPHDEDVTVNTVPWTRLNFEINKPFIYIITYSSDTTPGSSTFEATATASLDAVEDSELKIIGNTQGVGSVIGNIVIVK